MANITIPNLPSVSAATDLDILVIVNSGETTTSKITKADLLTGVGGAFEEDANGNVYIPSSITIYGEGNFLLPSSQETETWNTAGPKDNFMMLSPDSTIGRGPTRAFNNGIIASSQSTIDFYNTGAYNVMISTNGSKFLNNGFRNGQFGTRFCDISAASNSITAGAVNCDNFDGDQVAIIGANTCVSTNNDNSVIAASVSSSINSGLSQVAVIGCDSYTATKSNSVYVPELVITNYSSLNFSGDTAAAAGGVILGGIYHDNGALRVRIS